MSTLRHDGEISRLGRRLRAGEVTARHLAETALTALDDRGRRLNAVAALTPDRALREADRADAELRAGIDRGPLHGIPYGAKDLLAAAGAPTTWGAAPLRAQNFAEDAAVVARLRKAGAVLVAKLATVELAGGFGYDQADAAWTGPGRNAHDPERWAGGSSSGAGAAVGAGLVPFAIGTETWGSIVIPACLNGVVGVRPTAGTVDRRGAMALSWSMDKIGPLARTIDDCAAVLATIADPAAAAAPAFAGDGRPTGFRVGVVRGSQDGCDLGVRRAFAAALEALGEIAEVATFDLPDLPWAEAAEIVVAAEAAAAFEEFVLSGLAAHLTAPEDRVGALDGLTIPAVDYLRALRIRRLGRRALAAAMTGFDAVVAPAAPRVAPRLDESFEAWFGEWPGHLGAAGNLCGLPAVALPIGSADFGLPAGAEIAGHPGGEGRLLAVAAAWERVLRGGFAPANAPEDLN